MMLKLAVLNTHPIQYFAPLYRRLAKEPNIDLTVYFCSRQGVEEYLDRGFGQRFKWDVSLLEGFKHNFLQNRRRRDDVGGFWSLINPGIIQELRRNNYHALWVNGHNHATYLIAILAAKTLGIKVLMRCETHLRLHRSALKLAVRKPIMRVLYRNLCFACLPIGTRNREFYQFHGVGDEKLFDVPYAVDNDFFLRASQQHSKADVRRELGLPQGKPVILFASKLTARKRPMDLLQAFVQLRKSGRDAALAFIGAGTEEQELKHHVSENGLRDVFFFGFRNQSELPKFYSAVDVFVLPSENEPWGLILNEAMCAGLPVVTSAEIGATPDLVHHKVNGFAFSSGNIAELGNYLSQLVENAELRSKMGAESLRIIQKWNFDACIKGIRDALAQIAPGSQPMSEQLMA